MSFFNSEIFDPSSSFAEASPCTYAETPDTLTMTDIQKAIDLIKNSMTIPKEMLGVHQYSKEDKIIGLNTLKWRDAIKEVS